MKKEKKKTNKVKKKSSIKTKIATIIFLLLGCVCGVMMGRMTDSITGKEGSLGTDLILLGVMLLVFVVILYAHIIIHEGGHLVAGLFSGYKFSSFRIGSIMLFKEGDKYYFKKYSLAGTGGQCLMAPPDMVDGMYPYKLYNYGGVIANTIFGIFGLIVYFLGNDNPLWKFWLIFAFVGFVCAFVNGIPFKLAMVNNDGSNAKELGKNPEAMRAFWLQLKVNEMVSRGKLLQEIPEEWFEIPSDEDMKNSIVATIGVFACNRMMEEHRFSEAEAQIKKFLTTDNGLIGIYKSLLNCDRMYCVLLSDREDRNLIAEGIMASVGEKFIKSMKKFPSILRTKYVYALFVENDLGKANKIKGEFEKMAKTYPYKGDIETEAGLIALAEETYIGNNN